MGGKRSGPPGKSAGRKGGRKRKKKGWRAGLLSGAAAAGLILLARLFLVQAIAVPSRSMENTLLVGDYLLVDRFTYGARLPFSHSRLPGLRDPRPGEVIAFDSPVDPARIYVKRCIAVGGQLVEIRNKAVYVDGSRMPDPTFSKYLDARVLPAEESPRDNYGPERVPEGRFFVLGDNRDNSRDSRHWGTISRDRIVGRVLCVCWSCRPDPGTGGWLVRLAALPGRIRWNRIGARVR